MRSFIQTLLALSITLLTLPTSTSAQDWAFTVFEHKDVSSGGTCVTYTEGFSGNGNSACIPVQAKWDSYCYVVNTNFGSENCFVELFTKADCSSGYIGGFIGKDVSEGCVNTENVIRAFKVISC
ncbi:hypothetical protein MMC12_005663 [Toensbergia leucococca]|nr:hypothetical protein [Toensbergia leucococca]